MKTADQTEERHEFQFRGGWTSGKVFRMMADRTISAREFAILGIVSALVNDKTGIGCFASNLYIGRQVGLGPLPTSRSISKLVKLGLVVRKGEGKRRQLFDNAHENYADREAQPIPPRYRKPIPPRYTEEDTSYLPKKDNKTPDRPVGRPGDVVFSSQEPKSPAHPKGRSRPGRGSAAPASVSTPPPPPTSEKPVILPAKESKVSSPQDKKDAEEFIALLRKRNLFKDSRQHHSVDKWAKYLAAARHRHPADFDRAFRFHLKHVGEKYHPRLYSAKSFGEAFDDVRKKLEDADRLGKDNPAEVSDRARKIIDGIKAHDNVPFWVDGVLGFVTQQSLDGVRDAYEMARKGWEALGKGKPERSTHNGKVVWTTGRRQSLANYAARVMDDLKYADPIVDDRVRQFVDWAVRNPDRQCSPIKFVVSLTSAWLTERLTNMARLGGWGDRAWQDVLREARNA